MTVGEVTTATGIASVVGSIYPFASGEVGAGVGLIIGGSILAALGYGLSRLE